MDVANLAGEKEELNNQLKEMQQSECAAAADGDAVAFRSIPAFLHQLLSGLLFPFSIFTELQKAKEAEKQMNSHKVSFERMLQNERTLKIQVCVGAPTHAWNAWRALSPQFNFRGADVAPARRLWLRITLSCRLVLNLGSTSLRSVRFFQALMSVSLPGHQQAGRGDEQKGAGAGGHGGSQEGEGEQEAATGAAGGEGETQQHHHQVPEGNDRYAGGQ